LNCIVAKPAASEVVARGSSRRFRETKLIQFVVHEIVPVEQLHDCRLAEALGFCVLIHGKVQTASASLAGAANPENYRRYVRLSVHIVPSVSFPHH